LRILVTSFPAYGHFHTVAPLAQAAMDAGHDVIVASGPDMGDWIRSSGFSFEASGQAYDDHIAALGSESGPDRVAKLFTSVHVPPMLQGLVQLCERWRPHMVVHEEGEYAAPLLAHLLGVSCVTNSFAAPARPIAERSRSARFLQPIWDDAGAGEARYFGDLYLDACPPAFQSSAVEAIPNRRLIRPVLFDGPAVAVPEDLKNLTRPAAYVTLGTVPAFARPEVLRRIADALSEVVSTVIVTTGPNPTAILDGAPTGVHVAKYLPQSMLLPTVDVVVSHGGAGTTLGVILHGLPHVVVPQRTMSQLRNAERIAELGLGRSLDREASASEIAEATRQVLRDPSYAEATRKMAEALAQLPSPADVLADIADG
jgi:UDP:flavonoid glycosyltransferase YjiC (YdhE family)